MCFAVLLVVRCDDAAAKAPEKAADASAAGKAKADAAKDSAAAAKAAAPAKVAVVDAGKTASAPKASGAGKTPLADCLSHRPRYHLPVVKYVFKRGPPTPEEYVSPILIVIFKRTVITNVQN